MIVKFMTTGVSTLFFMGAVSNTLYKTIWFFPLHFYIIKIFTLTDSKKKIFSAKFFDANYFYKECDLILSALLHGSL